MNTLQKVIGIIHSELRRHESDLKTTPTFSKIKVEALEELHKKVSAVLKKSYEKQFEILKRSKINGNS